MHNNCERFLGLTDDLYAEGQYFMYSENYISGNTYTKSISLLAKAQESTDLNLLLRTMFNEAKSHGATMLELRGTSVMNSKLFNEAVPDGMAAQETFEAGVEYTGQAAVDLFNAVNSFYGYNNSSNNGFPSFNFSYFDPGGSSGGGGGGSSLSSWMQSYLSSPPDDHFNQFGQYLYTDNKATNNIVIDFQNPITGAMNTAPWLSTLLSDYKFDKSNYSVLTNIANYYAAQAGVNMNNLKNGSTSLGIANYHFERGKMVGKVYSFNGGEFKPDALMRGNFETQVISIMVGNGSVSEFLNDKYNMISSLGHEGGTVSHLTLNPKTWIDGVKAHIKIYEYQMQSQVYKFTTPSYKQKMRENLIEEQYNYKTYGPTK